MSSHPQIRWLLATIVCASVVALDATGPIGLATREAHAVVGRPLTPVSYAGVARRTTRRHVRRTSYAAPVATTTVVAAPITTLPVGCVRAATAGAVYYNCGATRYQPYYNGPTVVYRRVP